MIKYLLILFLFLFPVMAYSTTASFPFSSSFTGTATDPLPTGYSWEDYPGNAPWQGSVDGTTSAGHRGRISASDNYSGGAGGNGFGQVMGDGHNNPDGSHLRVQTHATGEFWIRWYQRYPAGFTWADGEVYYQKLIYTNPNESDGKLVIQWRDGTFGINLFDYGTINVQSSDTNGAWNTVMGGTTGDGEWHCYEFHVKGGTSGNSILEAWVDNNQVMSDTTRNISGLSVTVFELGTNSDSPANGSDTYVSWDDIAISTIGRIGLIDGGGAAATGSMSPGVSASGVTFR